MLVRHERKFSIGDRVRVVDVFCSISHMRTPNYVRGVEGVIFSDLGRYRDPTALSKGERSAPFLPLYRVHFKSEDILCAKQEAGHTVAVDVYGTWLEGGCDD